MEDLHTGRIAEHIFVLEALKRNLITLQPSSDYRGYDVAVHGKEKFTRVQIKSTKRKVPGKNYYKIVAGRGTKNKKKYTKDDCDILAVYVFEFDYWFIIPIEEVESVSVRLHPDKPEHKFTKFLHAWHLIK